MRTLLLALVALAVAGGLYWYLNAPDEGGGGGAPILDDEGLGDASDGGPALTAAGEQRVVRPAETAGAGWIQGTVTQGGEALEAAIELRHVDSLDPRNPSPRGAEMQMISRMLDSGVSVKPILKKTKTAPDGTYRFRDLAPGRYEVRATTESGAMGFASAALPAVGARVEASIEIPVGDGVLKGRVVQADGTPYRGLVVATAGDGFAVLMGGGGDVRPTYTDEEGRFTFGGLVPGKLMISAIIPGRMRVMGAPITLPHPDEYVLTIDGGGAKLKGTVISASDEQPIGGAVIFGGGGDPSAGFAIRSTVGAADGSFEITLPPGRGGGIFVQAEGYATGQHNMRGSPTEEVTVALVALGSVKGRITLKENGSPAAQVTVFARGSGGMGGMPTALTAVSDSDGSFIFSGVPPGAVTLHALGSGWVSEGYGAGESPFLVTVEPGETGEIEIQVVPGARAAGRVTTPEGDPVVGAVVHAATKGGGGSNFMALLLGAATTFGAVVTDAEGRYEIDVLAPEANYVITARAPDYPDAATDTFTASAGAVQTFDLVMQAPRHLHVRVVAAEGGAPVPGASVILRQGEANAFDMTRLLTGAAERTGTDGRVRVGPLSGAEAKLNVSAAGFVTTGEVKVEDDGSDAPQMTVELARGLVLAGKLQAPAGVPLQGVRVAIRRDGSRGRSWFHENATTDAAGAFRLDTIKDAGSCQVKAEVTWDEKTYKGELEVDTGAEDIVLQLEEIERASAGVLKVQVVDADGKSVPTGRILLQQRSENSNHSNYGQLSAGRATFRDVDAEAELWLEVYDVVGTRGATLQGPFSFTEEDLKIVLPIGRYIRGRVLGPDGAGVRAVRISATVQHADKDLGSGNVHGQGVSDAEGAFEIKGLGDHEYELSFTAPKDYAPIPSQKVRSGASGVEVRVRAGVRARLTLLDYRGEPISGAHAHASKKEKDSANSWRSFTQEPMRSNAKGEFELRGLDPDAEYSLRISPPESREDLRDLQIDPWAIADQTLRLKQAWRIRGVVKDQRGKPGIGIWVQARKEGAKDWNNTQSAHTDDKGAFTVEDLDQGRYELRARGMIDAPKEGIKTAAAGSDGIELSVDIGERLAIQLRGVKSNVDGRRPSATLKLKSENEWTTLSGDWEGSQRVSFQGLVPGRTYELWIVGISGNRYVHKDGIQAQDAELEVEPKAGQKIGGSVSVPAGISRRRVNVTASSKDGFSSSASVDGSTGRFEIEGLPPGTYEVRAHGWSDGSSYVANAQAAAGGEVLLELKKRN